MQTVLSILPRQRHVWPHRIISDWDEAMGIKQSHHYPPKCSTYRVRFLQTTR